MHAMGKQQKHLLSDKDIAVYALYVLGGWQKRIHTEDIVTGQSNAATCGRVKIRHW